MNKSTWNITEFLNNFKETHRENDIGDNVAIFYEESYLPIKINGVVEPKLKQFKGSICTYDIDEGTDTRGLPVEMIAIEEYSDSPYSIYIDVDGNVTSYEYTDIFSIEIGGLYII